MRTTLLPLTSGWVIPPGIHGDTPVGTHIHGTTGPGVTVAGTTVGTTVPGTSTGISLGIGAGAIPGATTAFTITVGAGAVLGQTLGTPATTTAGTTVVLTTVLITAHGMQAEATFGTIPAHITCIATDTVIGVLVPILTGTDVQSAQGLAA